MRIAIVALNAFPAIEPSQGRRIGGLETFAWNLARGLAQDEADQILFLVRSEQPKGTRVYQKVHVDFIHEPLRAIRQSVSKALEIDSSKKLLRIKNWDLTLAWKIPTLAIRKFFFPRYSEEKSISLAINRFAPELLLTLGVNQTSASLGEIAQALGIPIVLWLQSNADLAPQLFESGQFVDRYGVRSAHAQRCIRLCRNIICQTETQQLLLQQIEPKFPNTLSQPIRATCIPNPIETKVFHPGESPFHERRGVLWIGRADRFHKRPLIAIEIAKRCPDISFCMIVNPGDDDVYQEINNTKPPNVSLIDFVPSSEMPERMRKAWIFLSTGSAAYEGFPNVLLEASASGTPIVSLEDFDGFLSRSKGGLSSDGNLDSLVQFMHRLVESPSEWRELGSSAIEYVRNYHDLATVVERFRNEAVLAAVVR